MERKAQILVQKIVENRLSISLAESCTGGMITSLLVGIPGVSDILLEGLVTYSNESKMKRLGVKRDTLEKFGAVSAETVHEMLSGLETQVGIAVSGIAGPGGGTQEKPVGTVFIGAKKGDQRVVKRFNFDGDRMKIRTLSTESAIELALQLFEKEQ